MRLQSPDTGTTTYRYDAAGNRVRQTDARGVQVSYAYDALSRLTAVRYPDASLDVSYFYDEPAATTACTHAYTSPLGRLTRIVDSTGSTTYCHDDLGRLRLKTQVVDGRTFRVGYSYTKGDRLAALSYPSGLTLRFSYDASGRATALAYRPGGGTADIVLVSDASYAPFGPATAVRNGLQKRLVRGLDLNYAPTAIDSDTPGGLGLRYTTDETGNISRLTSAASGRNAPRVDLEYDPLKRLTGAYNANGHGQAFGYTATGDRSEIADVGFGPILPVDYAFAPGTHRLVAVGSTPRSVDEAGNTTSRGDGIDLAYDQRNRLAEVTLPGGNTRYTYLYNGKGERVGKKKALAGNTVGATYYVYDEGGRLLGEYTASGAPVAEYLCFNDALYAVATPSDLDYVETDHLGTPRKLWSTSRQTYVWSWDVLDAKGLFGATSPDADPDLDGVPRVFNLRFPGQYFDAETGLHYNYFRDYEPGTGRYIKSDPIGLRGGPNTYAYVDAKPLMLVDPYGQSACESNCCANASWPQTEGGVVGGRVMCCKKQPVACVNPHVCDGLSNEACLIAKQCAARHEQYHIDNGHSDCSGQSDGPATPRDKNSNECDTYTAMERCFSLMFCNGSTRCQQEIRLLQKKNQDQKNFYCSRKGN